MKSMLISVFAGMLIGLCCGYKFYHVEPVLEKYAPPVRQADKSLILEKKPAAEPKAKQQIPHGSKVERVVSVTVRPKPKTIPRTSSQWSEAGKSVEPCPDVTVDLSLVKNADDTRSVIASSPDGEVISGVDIPAQSLPSVSAPLKWSVGATYFSNKWYSANVSRNWGPLRAGVEVLKTPNDLIPGINLNFNF